MSQENYTTTKNYTHSRENVLEVLRNVIIGLNKEDSEMFAGYLRGVGFAIELLEAEWNSSKD